MAAVDCPDPRVMQNVKKCGLLYSICCSVHISCISSVHFLIHTVGATLYQVPNSVLTDTDRRCGMPSALISHSPSLSERNARTECGAAWSEFQCPATGQSDQIVQSDKPT